MWKYVLSLKYVYVYLQIVPTEKNGTKLKDSDKWFKNKFHIKKTMKIVATMLAEFNRLFDECSKLRLNEINFEKGVHSRKKSNIG